jgi:hypothetical protein
MTSIIRQFLKTPKPIGDTEIKTLTRPQRRKAVLKIIAQLNKVMIGEQKYRDEIPEQFTQRYDAADQICEYLSEAIACLEEAFP